MFFFDARMIASSGIGTQVLNVLRLLQSSKNAPTLLGDPFLIGKLLPNYPGRMLKWKARIYSVKEQFSCPSFAASDYAHFPHYCAPVKELQRAFVVVHDLIHLQSPEFRFPAYRLYARFLLSRIARDALHIITVSHATRAAFLEEFPAAENKCTTVYNGINHDLFKPESAERIKLFKKKMGLPSEYLLTAGIAKKHKNLDGLLRALLPLWRQNKLPPLAIAGSGGKLPDYASGILSETEQARYLILLAYLPEAQLPLAYAGAKIFIQPSYLEGFGFPLAEAQACGAICVSSDRMSLPEVGGDAALYFDPFNSEQICAQTLLALSNVALRKNLKKKGIQQARKFSWKDHMTSLKKIYRSHGLEV